MIVREVLATIETMDGVLDRAILKEADGSQYKHDCYIVHISDMCTIRSIFHEYKNILLDLKIEEE